MRCAFRLCLVICLLQAIACTNKLDHPSILFEMEQKIIKDGRIGDLWELESSNVQAFYNDIAKELRKPSANSKYVELHKILKLADCVKLQSLTGKRVHNFFLEKLLVLFDIDLLSNKEYCYTKKEEKQYERDDCSEDIKENKIILVYEKGGWKYDTNIHEEIQIMGTVLNFHYRLLRPGKEKDDFFCDL